MPAYQNATPPRSLFSGDVGFSFNNEAFPGAATSGTQFALPSFTGTNDPGTAVRWQTIFATAPTAVNIVLQGAMADVDAEYRHVDCHNRRGALDSERSRAWRGASCRAWLARAILATSDTLG